MSTDELSLSGSVASGTTPRLGWPQGPIGCKQRGLAVWMGLGNWRGRLAWLILLLPLIWLLDRQFAWLAMSENFLLGDIRDVSRQFGEPVGIAWISAVIWCLDRSRRRPLLIALIAAMVASGLASGAKLLVGRERPKVTFGETVLNGPYWPGTMKPDASFPSGHTATAFAFAYGMSRLYPLHRRLWLFLAAVCGMSRVLGEAHFLTDVTVGAWLGWEVARVVWETFPGKRLTGWLDKRIPRTHKVPQWDWDLGAELPPLTASSTQGGLENVRVA